VAGDRRVVGLARVDDLVDGLRALEAQAVEDLGGEETISALRHEVLRLGLHAERIGMLLLAEIEEKARQSREAGHVPHVSRYRATGCVATFLDLAARLYRHVGLERRARKLPSLSLYLAQRGDAQAGAGGENAAGLPPSPAPPSDRASEPASASKHEASATPSRVNPA
jgi:hypothetical protein